jgi:hypothetical protein
VIVIVGMIDMSNSDRSSRFLEIMMGVSIVIVIIAFYNIGWIASANTIKTECQKLGSFYVGDHVIECKLK